MNAQRKKGAVLKFQPLVEQGATIEDITLQLETSESKYNPDEVKEITDALFETKPAEINEGVKEMKAEPKKEAKVTKVKPEVKEGIAVSETLNRDYEEWKVKALYKEVQDELGNVKGRKLIGFEKDAMKAIRTTRLTPERADLLNSQSENTLLRLYEVTE